MEIHRRSLVVMGAYVTAIATLVITVECEAKEAPPTTSSIENVFAQCRRACGSAERFAEVTLVRKQETWQITGVCLEVGRDCDLARLTSLSALESLQLRISRATALGLRQLAKLPNLRRFEATMYVITTRRGVDCSTECVESIAKLPQLDEVNLNCLVSIGDDGIVPISEIRGLRRLELDALGLSDKSLRYINRLTRLEELDIGSTADITDKGMEEIKGLVNLRSLAIDELGPDGAASLAKMPRLDELRVAVYYPKGQGRLAELSGLNHLGIWVAKGGPKVGLPRGLRRLDVSLETVGRLDLQLSKQINHVRLELPWNDHHREAPGPFGESADVKWLGSLSELQELELRDANDADVRAITGLTSLRALTLTSDSPEVKLGDDGMKSLAQLGELESLTMHNGWSVTDSGMDSIRRLSKLRRLSLTGSFPRLTLNGLAALQDLKRLRALTVRLKDAVFEGHMDRPLAHLKGLDELEDLSLQGQITDEGLRSLAGLKKLRRLNLVESRGFSDAGIALLMRSLPSIETVRMTITGEVANHRSKRCDSTEAKP